MVKILNRKTIFFLPLHLPTKQKRLKTESTEFLSWLMLLHIYSLPYITNSRKVFLME